MAGCPHPARHSGGTAFQICIGRLKREAPNRGGSGLYLLDIERHPFTTALGMESAERAVGAAVAEGAAEEPWPPLAGQQLRPALPRILPP